MCKTLKILFYCVVQFYVQCCLLFIIHSACLLFIIHSACLLFIIHSACLLFIIHSACLLFIIHSANTISNVIVIYLLIYTINSNDIGIVSSTETMHIKNSNLSWNKYITNDCMSLCYDFRVFNNCTAYKV